MTTQSTNHVLLIRPAEFYCNDQTMETNHYQISDDTISRDKTLSMATSEFDQFKKNCLLNGLDDIELTMKKFDKIKSFEDSYFLKFPWLGQ